LLTKADPKGNSQGDPKDIVKGLANITPDFFEKEKNKTTAKSMASFFKDLPE
jgi:hypothetical protein